MPVPSDPYDFTNGATADAEQVDARFAPLYAALDGALDDENVAAFTSEVLKLTVGRVGLPTSDVTIPIGSVKTDLCSVSLTPAVASKLLVLHHATISSGNVSGFVRSWINVDGTDRVSASPPVAAGDGIIDAGGASLFGVDVVDLTAASHTIKLRADWDGVAPLSALRGYTGFAYLLIAA